MVAAASASSTFAGRASVAELWASLPEFPTPRETFGERVPRCLVLNPVLRASDPFFGPITHATFLFAPDDIATLADTYPTMAGIAQDGTRPAPLGEEPLFHFLDENGNERSIFELSIDAPSSDRFLGPRIVRPKVGSDPIGPPSEFMTLWALLYCLSELARYFPDTWVLALDPDRSRASTTLEHGLDLALDYAPELIYDGLEGQLRARVREQLDSERLEHERQRVGGGSSMPAQGDSEGSPQPPAG